MNPENVKIYNRIKDLSDADGITIAELERNIGFGNGKIGKWRNSPKSPTYESLLSIATYFETTVAYLTGENSDQKDLHLRLKELCKSRGTSIAALESRLGMGNGTIGKWWKNGRVPNYTNLSAVANALETTIAYLTGETDDPAAGIKKERPADGEALTDKQKEAVEFIKSLSDDDLRRFIAAAKAMLGE